MAPHRNGEAAAECAPCNVTASRNALRAARQLGAYADCHHSVQELPAIGGHWADMAAMITETAATTTTTICYVTTDTTSTSTADTTSTTTITTTITTTTTTTTIPLTATCN